MDIRPADDFAGLSDDARALIEAVYDTVIATLTLGNDTQNDPEVTDAHRQASEAIAAAEGAGIPHRVIEGAMTAAMTTALSNRDP